MVPVDWLVLACGSFFRLPGRYSFGLLVRSLGWGGCLETLDQPDSAAKVAELVAKDGTDCFKTLRMYKKVLQNTETFFKKTLSKEGKIGYNRKDKKLK